MDNTLVADVVKQEIKLADYQPPAFFITDVELVFRIFGDKVLVRATSQVECGGQGAADLKLDGGPYMKLVAVEIDCKQLSNEAYSLTEESLVLLDVPRRFTLTIETELRPADNTRLEGLYQSGGNLCTQCEAEGFRHITYFLDRPDVLAVYDVTIEADANRYPVLLSNGDLHSNGMIDGGRHFARWKDPHPKPSYLYALVAGTLSAVTDSYTTKSGRDVTLNIYVREPDLDKCAYAMQSLKKSMKWDEDVFDLEYDLGVYNIVAVSDFNMGAMENKGLNIFNTKYVLANEKTATDSDFDHVEGVIGHEYFHNWTGNRVTCRDWFQLSLKEGLTVYRDQEFSSDMTSRAVKRIDDVRVLRMLQFPEDGGPLAHPVRPESYLEINNFYTTTVYNKGAEVIRMMSTLMGRSAFVEGVKLYLSRHDGQAATCEQFVEAMEAASSIDLGQFRRWYSQAGTPTIEFSRERSGNDVILSVRQDCPATPGQPTKLPFHMPLLVGWLDENGTEIDLAVTSGMIKTDEGYLLELSEERQSFTFKDMPRGACPSLMRGFSAPVKIVDDLTDVEMAHLLKCDSNPFVRWQSGQNLMTSYLLASLDPLYCESSEGMHKRALISQAFEATMKDQTLDPAFAAELLTLPSEIYLGQQQEILTPVEIHQTYGALKSHLASEHLDLMAERFEMLNAGSIGSDQVAKGNRKLRNVMLGFMAVCKKNQASAKSRTIEHYNVARSMTDQLAAFTLIAHSDWPEKENILTDFYQQWKEEDLVIDKWFAVQAQDPCPNTVNRIRQLMKHPAFTLENPNRLRSLISMFAMLNQVNFHSQDGSGYNLLSSVIADVDQLNPQTAARMVAPLGRWMRLDSKRKKMMKQSLVLLQNNSVLSNDVRELVEKSLR